MLFLLCVLCSSSVKALIVLQYHHVSNSTPHSTSISPELFRQHLNYLESEGFNIVSLKEFVELLDSEKNSSDKSILITFDDGYRTIYENAYPLLKAKNFPFTVFINIEPIQNKIPQFMGWSQLKEMQKHGASIANHSFSHEHLIRWKKGEKLHDWKSRVTGDIFRAQKVLEDRLSVSNRAFAYPYGEYSFDLKAVLKEFGYLAFGQNSGAVLKASDKQAIPRFPFGGRYGDIDDFALKVNSLAMPVDKVEIADERGKPLRDHVLPVSVEKPILRVKLQDQTLHRRLSCFLTGQRELNVVTKNDFVQIQPVQKLPVGRSRINCTAPSAQAGRFYWYSQPWIKTNSDGSWYQE